MESRVKDAVDSAQLRAGFPAESRGGSVLVRSALGLNVDERDDVAKPDAISSAFHDETFDMNPRIGMDVCEPSTCAK